MKFNKEKNKYEALNRIYEKALIWADEFSGTNDTNYKNYEELKKEIDADYDEIFYHLENGDEDN